MTTTKNPSTIFYWNDWENDPELKACSLAAQGLWMRLLCIAARSAEPGVVAIGGFPSARAEIAQPLARLVGLPAAEVDTLIDELVLSGAAGLDRKGRLVNRRMLKAARIRSERSVAGKRGADKTNGKRAGKIPATGAANVAANGSPSSRLPDSLSPEVSERARPIDVEWMPGEAVRARLAAARPDIDDARLERRMLEFRNWCAARATRTHDADATWFNFMLQTREEERSGHGPRHPASRRDKPTSLADARAGIDAAFAARPARHD